jgi:hypothetical protein
MKRFFSQCHNLNNVFLALQPRRTGKMKRHLILFAALLGFALPISCFASTRQLLYVQHGQSLVTYSVNPVTAVAQKLGSLTLKSLPAYSIQVLHAPASPYVYVLGFTSKTNEFIWVYATTSKGVPIPTPIQTLSVKPALTRFLIHPNGNFAYALYDWVTDFQSVGDVVLYTVNPKTGKLVNTKKPVANFPPSDAVAYTNLYAINGKGTKLYIQQFGMGTGDYYSTINPKTGLLGKVTHFWGDSNGEGESDTSDFSDLLIAQAFNIEFLGNGINIYKNIIDPNVHTPLIACTDTMLAICGDAGDKVKFDPTGKYLFITSNAIHSVEVAAVHVTAKSLVATDSIPGTPSTLVFSPNGRIVYAQEGNQVLIYVFDPATGLLGAKSSITIPSGFVFIYPAS